MGKLPVIGEAQHAVHSPSSDDDSTSSDESEAEPSGLPDAKEDPRFIQKPVWVNVKIKTVSLPR